MPYTQTRFMLPANSRKYYTPVDRHLIHTLPQNSPVFDTHYTAAGVRSIGWNSRALRLVNGSGGTAETWSASGRVEFHTVTRLSRRAARNDVTEVLERNSLG